jgi:hypothetical protein
VSGAQSARTYRVSGRGSFLVESERGLAPTQSPACRPEHASRLGVKTRLFLARSATVAWDERSSCFAHPAGIAGFWLWRARGLRCCPETHLKAVSAGRLPGRKIPSDLFEVRSDGVEGIAAEGHP